MRLASLLLISLFSSTSAMFVQAQEDQSGNRKDYLERFDREIKGVWKVYDYMDLEKGSYNKIPLNEFWLNRKIAFRKDKIFLLGAEIVNLEEKSGFFSAQCNIRSIVKIRNMRMWRYAEIYLYDWLKLPYSVIQDMNFSLVDRIRMYSISCYSNPGERSFEWHQQPFKDLIFFPEKKILAFFGIRNWILMRRDSDEE